MALACLRPEMCRIIRSPRGCRGSPNRIPSNPSLTPPGEAGCLGHGPGWKHPSGCACPGPGGLLWAGAAPLHARLRLRHALRLSTAGGFSRRPGRSTPHTAAPSRKSSPLRRNPLSPSSRHYIRPKCLRPPPAPAATDVAAPCRPGPRSASTTSCAASPRHRDGRGGAGADARPCSTATRSSAAPGLASRGPPSTTSACAPSTPCPGCAPTPAARCWNEP